ncbi:MAG: TonB-dependent receptor, partial [Betaproteobacteria bacterium]
SNFIVTDTRVFHLSPRVKHLSKALGRENELILGADLYDWDLYKTDTITPWGTTLSQLTMLDQRNVGVYVKDTIQISDKFLVTGGYRYENQKIDASDKDITSSSQDQNMSAYDFGGKYDLSDTVTFRASISKAFRTANADEVGFSSEYDTSWNRVFQFLRPQVSHTHEIGLDITDGNIYLKTALFQIDTKDEIRLENLTSGVGNTNYPFTQRRGIELRGGLDLSTWSLAANYAYTQAKFLTGYLEGQSGYISNIDLTDKTIPMVPRHRLSINAGKKFNDAFRIDSNWSYFSEQFMDNDESNSLGRQIPGFSVLDVKASMQLSDYSLALSVNNVLDREYYSYAVRSQTSGNDKFNVYPHAGRAVFLTLEYAFDLN